VREASSGEVLRVNTAIVLSLGSSGTGCSGSITGSGSGVGATMESVNQSVLSAVDGRATTPTLG
jgi:hypothetical protein